MLSIDILKYENQYRKKRNLSMKLKNLRRIASMNAFLKSTIKTKIPSAVEEAKNT